MRPRIAEECLFHWSAVVRAADTAWDQKFAREIADKAIKPWWKPSAKQLAVMQRMTDELFSEADNFLLESYEEPPVPTPLEAVRGVMQQGRQVVLCHNPKGGARRRA